MMHNPWGPGEAATDATAARGAPHIWPVGALCLAIGDALQARFGAVAVEGEISSLTQAGSGHWYFTLKDAQGQLRCAMFRRAASLLGFTPREGERVVVQGRVGVYGARGDLQLVVEHMRRAGLGQLYEQFLRLKDALQQEGLFDTARKRTPVAVPRGVAVVTSPNAAALRDVISALRRRAPHVPVLLAPALVQGAGAPQSLCQALRTLYAQRRWPRQDGGVVEVDTILLVRGGGSMEDLWAFNDPALARLIVQSPVPVIAGVGHESDVTIADWCADVRAPTPTAAAELAAIPQAQALAACQQAHDRLAQAVDEPLQRHSQRLQQAARTLARPSLALLRHQSALASAAQRLQWQVQRQGQQHSQALQALAQRWQTGAQQRVLQEARALEQAALRLRMLDPQQVLERGYAILTTTTGQVVRDAAALQPGQTVQARLAQGQVALQVPKPRAVRRKTPPAQQGGLEL